MPDVTRTKSPLFSKLRNEVKGAALIWLVIAVVVGGVGYLFVDSISEKNRLLNAQIELEKERLRYQQEKDLKEAEQEEAERKAITDEEEQKQLRLETCLEVARLNYNSNWKTSCNTKYESGKAEYELCIQRCKSPGISCLGGDPVAFCKLNYPFAAYDPECSLNSSTASRWDEIHEKEQGRCYEQYN